MSMMMCRRDIGKKMALAVTSTKTEDGERTYSVKARRFTPRLQTGEFPPHGTSHRLRCREAVRRPPIAILQLF
jgi:hypothetical protein